MTHTGRVGRGHPAHHNTSPHRPSDRRTQRPTRAGTASTPPGPSTVDSTVDSDELAGRGLVRRSRRGITRPPHRDSPDRPATPPATPPVDSSGTADDSRVTEPLLFTAEQAAALLQVRPSWLRRKAAARAVPCRFVGKHLRFSHADIKTIADGDTP